MNFRLVPMRSDRPARYQKNRKPCDRSDRTPSSCGKDASFAYQLTFVVRKSDLPSRVS